MEARVDIKKLQLLNDRIVQTIDALNQVRMTVHGLAHTAGTSGGIGAAFGTGNLPFSGIGASAAFGQPAVGLNVQGMPAAYASPSYAAFGTVPGGLSHSGVNPVGQTFLGTTMPQAIYGQAIAPSVQSLGMFPAWPQASGIGLSHSTLEEQWIAELRAQDPRRLSQTFPYCYNP